MEFALPRRRERTEAIVPMINVVFLLLIFFLMTAEIAPPEPFAVTAPLAEAEAAERLPDTLYVAADGALGFDGVVGDAVFAALVARGDGALAVRADAALAGAELARLLPRLAAVGVADVRLMVGAK